MDPSEKMFAAIVYGGGAAMLVLMLALAPAFAAPAGGTVGVPLCPQYALPPPGTNPPQCGGPGDAAEDCIKPGAGRPWCR